MDEDLFSRIIKAVDAKVKEDSSEIDKNNFSKIVAKDCLKKIAFIDGGQAEILKAVNFSLQFIRIAGLVLLDNKKIDSFVNEFFVLISSEREYHKAETFSVKGDCISGFSINMFDASIREGNEKASVSKIGGVIRRFAEIDMAKKVCSYSDIIVLDGSLKAMIKGEDEKIKSLIEKGKENNVIICGLAKTSKNLSSIGNCILSSLNLTKEGEWSYKLKDEEDYCVEVVKLNKSSNYVFEFNIAKNQNKDEVLNLLLSNSNDAVFPGYPYGLILVDKLARISNEEKDYLLTKFQAKSGESWKKIKKALNVLNSHDMLDNM